MKNKTDSLLFRLCASSIVGAITLSAVLSDYSGVIQLNLGWGAAQVTIDGTPINKLPKLSEVP